MRIPFFKFLVLLSSVCFGQTKGNESQLIGFVREQNTGIKLADVIVRSSGTSNPVQSTASGDFILTFQDQEPGTSIVVRAVKNGWELVNEKEMSTSILKNPYEKPFKIILCKAGTLAKAKSIYYETFELNLQKELAKQKAANKGNDKKIASLEQDFAKVQKQLNDLADEYSRIDLSDAFAKDLEAIELFKEGKYDEFIALKNTSDLETQVAKAIKSKAEAKKVIANDDSTINLYFKSQKDIANTLVLQFKFDEAEKAFENLVAKDTSNFDNTYSFALFLQKQNQQFKALRYYLSALKLAQREVETAMTQNNMGILYNDINDYPAAMNAYGKALEIYTRLAITNPATYVPNVAGVQNNLGILYNANMDYSAALNAYGKAFEIYLHLAKTNPSEYEPDEAKSQNNLGGLYLANMDYPAALNAFNNALEINQRLAKTNPFEYEPYVAMTQLNLGALHHDLNDYSASLNAYVKALEIYNRLAITNPATFEPNVALAQNNLGLLYKANIDYSAALNAYGKAFEIYQHLAKTNPATYEPNIGQIQNDLGLLYLAKMDYSAALNAFSNALEINERLANVNPNKYDVEFCRGLVSLGLLQEDHYQENRQKIIEQYLSKAKQILLKYTQRPFAKELLEKVNGLEKYFKVQK